MYVCAYIWFCRPTASEARRGGHEVRSTLLCSATTDHSVSSQWTRLSPRRLSSPVDRHTVKQITVYHARHLLVTWPHQVMWPVSTLPVTDRWVYQWLTTHLSLSIIYPSNCTNSATFCLWLINFCFNFNTLLLFILMSHVSRLHVSLKTHDKLPHIVLNHNTMPELIRLTFLHCYNSDS